MNDVADPARGAINRALFEAEWKKLEARVDIGEAKRSELSCSRIARLVLKPEESARATSAPLPPPVPTHAPDLTKRQAERAERRAAAAQHAADQLAAAAQQWGSPPPAPPPLSGAPPPPQSGAPPPPRDLGKGKGAGGKGSPGRGGGKGGKGAAPSGHNSEPPPPPSTAVSQTPPPDAAGHSLTVYVATVGAA